MAPPPKLPTPASKLWGVILELSSNAPTDHFGIKLECTEGPFCLNNIGWLDVTSCMNFPILRDFLPLSATPSGINNLIIFNIKQNEMVRLLYTTPFSTVQCHLMLLGHFQRSQNRLINLVQSIPVWISCCSNQVFLLSLGVIYIEKWGETSR